MNEEVSEGEKEEAVEESTPVDVFYNDLLTLINSHANQVTLVEIIGVLEIVKERMIRGA